MRPISLCLSLVVLLAGCSKNGPEPPTIADLKAMLQQNDPQEQLVAAAWVQQLGLAAAEARPELIAALKSPHASVRQSVAAALGELAPDIADAIPPLTAALGDPDYSVRQAAAETLGKLGPAASSAIPALESMSKQADPCSAGQSALKKIRGG